MKFHQYPQLVGTHAPYSASQSAWLRYDETKAVRVHLKKKAAMRGTILHDWAQQTIKLGIKQPDSNKTLYAYVNDAIGFRMDTEVILYYSPRFYGTADSISFRKINGRDMLRIHDLKTGEEPVSMDQLKVYAAFFCLEYKVKPQDIDIELRIYQNNKVIYCNPTAEEIQSIMDFVVARDKLLDKVDNEEE